MTLTAPGSILWLLAHEMRIYWRNFRAGRAGKGARGLISLVVVATMLVGGGVLAALGLHAVEVGGRAYRALGERPGDAADVRRHRLARRAPVDLDRDECGIVDHEGRLQDLDRQGGCR